MNTLYLVCSHSCMSQMEIPYLLNNSPELHGNSNPGEHYATYELNGEVVDGETGPLGTIRVHDDYWNINEVDVEWYNYEVRNTMNITEDQLNGLLNIIEDKSIALLLHAQNYDDIWAWSRDLPVIVIRTIVGDWEDNIVEWAAREYNTIMEDPRNANYSDADHSWPGVDGVASAFARRLELDNDIDEYTCDHLLTQSQWMTLNGLQSLWATVGIESPDNNWIHQYYEDFRNHQDINKELAEELKNAKR